MFFSKSPWQSSKHVASDFGPQLKNFLESHSKSAEGEQHGGRGARPSRQLFALAAAVAASHSLSHSLFLLLSLSLAVQLVLLQRRRSPNPKSKSSCCCCCCCLASPCLATFEACLPHTEAPLICPQLAICVRVFKIHFHLRRNPSDFPLHSSAVKGAAMMGNGGGE